MSRREADVPDRDHGVRRPVPRAVDSARRMACVLALLVMVVAEGSASTLEISYAGQGSGSVGGTAFDDAEFVITGMLDSTTWSPLVGSSEVVYTAAHTEASIAIEGVGVFGFVTTVGAFVNQTTGLLGLVRFDGDGDPTNDLYHSPFDPVLQTWDLSSPLPELVGNGRLLQWSFLDVITDGGLLLFDDSQPAPVAVLVASVPEPTGALLFATAMLMTTVGRRRAFAGRLPVATRSTRSCRRPR